MDIRTVDNYNTNAEERCSQYESIDFQWLYDLVGKYIKPGRTILEIGCGSGRDARKLSALGYDVTATDASSGMLKQARKLDIGNTVNFQEKSFPLEANDQLFRKHYDVIIAMAVLMHIPLQERNEFLSQITKLLTLNGIAIISWSNNRNDNNRLFESLDLDDAPNVFSEANLGIIETLYNADALGRNVAWFTVVARKTILH